MAIRLASTARRTGFWALASAITGDYGVQLEGDVGPTQARGDDSDVVLADIHESRKRMRAPDYSPKESLLPAWASARELVASSQFLPDMREWLIVVAHLGPSAWPSLRSRLDSLDPATLRDLWLRAQDQTWLGAFAGDEGPGKPSPRQLADHVRSLTDLNDVHARERTEQVLALIGEGASQDRRNYVLRWMARRASPVLLRSGGPALLFRLEEIYEGKEYGFESVLAFLALMRAGADGGLQFPLKSIAGHSRTLTDVITLLKVTHRESALTRLQALGHLRGASTLFSVTNDDTRTPVPLATLAQDAHAQLATEFAEKVSRELAERVGRCRCGQIHQDPQRATLLKQLVER